MGAMSHASTDEVVLAVVIGRAGSKGLPRKNALEVAGVPMIAHTIRAARAATSVQRIVVSTDGAEIAAIAQREGVEVSLRSAELASDTATVDSAVRHAVEACGSRASIIVILYGNVPVRPEGLIDRAVAKLRATGADSVQSYYRVGKTHPYWMSQLDSEGRVSAFVENRIYRRQELPPVFMPDGGVIAVQRASLFSPREGEPHAFFGRDRRGIENEEGAVIDVDTALDLAVAEATLLKLEGPSR
ncbi:MAG: acylneuraminate cytidylyltransferase family protein [Planctomycetota bacterium]|nr:MAG: acylneuraminate cytidylyltransferase family protein [Planctomycetota bacterium]